MFPERMRVLPALSSFADASLIEVWMLGSSVLSAWRASPTLDRASRIFATLVTMVFTLVPMDVKGLVLVILTSDTYVNLMLTMFNVSVFRLREGMVIPFNVSRINARAFSMGAMRVLMEVTPWRTDTMVETT